MAAITQPFHTLPLTIRLAARPPRWIDAASITRASSGKRALPEDVFPCPETSCQNQIGLREGELGQRAVRRATCAGYGSETITASPNVA